MRLCPQFLYGAYEAEPTVEDDGPLVSAADEPRPLSATLHTRLTWLASTGDENKTFDSTHSIRPWWHSKTQAKEQQERQGTQNQGTQNAGSVPLPVARLQKKNELLN